MSARRQHLLRWHAYRSRCGKYSQATTVRGQLVDTKYLQPIGLEDAVDGCQGKIGEVFMVYGVELGFGEQSQQMRELKGLRHAP